MIHFTGPRFNFFFFYLTPSGKDNRGPIFYRKTGDQSFIVENVRSGRILVGRNKDGRRHRIAVCACVHFYATIFVDMFPLQAVFICSRIKKDEDQGKENVTLKL